METAAVKGTLPSKRPPHLQEDRHRYWDGSRRKCRYRQGVRRHQGLVCFICRNNYQPLNPYAPAPSTKSRFLCFPMNPVHKSAATQLVTGHPWRKSDAEPKQEVTCCSLPMCHKLPFLLLTSYTYVLPDLNKFVLFNQIH